MNDDARHHTPGAKIAKTAASVPSARVVEWPRAARRSKHLWTLPTVRVGGALAMRLPDR